MPFLAPERVLRALLFPKLLIGLPGYMKVMALTASLTLMVNLVSFCSTHGPGASIWWPINAALMIFIYAGRMARSCSGRIRCCYFPVAKNFIMSLQLFFLRTRVSSPHRLLHPGICAASDDRDLSESRRIHAGQSKHNAIDIGISALPPT